MARRGFLAELQHQRQIAAREQARRAQEAERARIAANRAAEQARGLRSVRPLSSLAPLQPTRSGSPRRLRKHTLPRWRPRRRGATSTVPAIQRNRLIAIGDT